MKSIVAVLITFLMLGCRPLYETNNKSDNLDGSFLGLEIKLEKIVYRRGESVRGYYVNNSGNPLYTTANCVGNFEVKRGGEWQPTRYLTFITKRKVFVTPSKEKVNCTPCKNDGGFAPIEAGEFKPLRLSDSEITGGVDDGDITKQTYRIVAFVAPRESCDAVTKVVSNEIRFTP
ncbi:hypothetical protein ACN4EK_13550 [Pantanalinema rosaneae CENA516]|uniref:hypothetical protein n=1 Tax=Pantanalinema rosaneae TaxID=1620701 RepID=UPI003D6F210B